MKFTDEDLKQFRSWYDEMGAEKIQALIARLKASEECMRFSHDGEERTQTPCSVDCLACKAYRTWKEIAGK